MADERILIVEDETIVAEQLQQRVEELGYQVCGIASSAEEAIRLVKAKNPQLVLMELHLSDTTRDGINVAEQFRQHADIPIIFMTAYTDRETIARAKRMMPFDYLLKPLRRHEIEYTLDIALYKYRMEKELLTSHHELERRVQERTEELELRNKELQQEILDRVEAEMSFIQEQTLMRTLMETTPDHIYFKDWESRFIRVNSSMSKWLGLQTPDGAIGRTDFDFFTEEHARQAALDERNVMESGQFLLGKEEKETWPDGRETWVSSVKAPLRNEQGDIVGTFGISRDITARKQAEAELHRYQEHLEELVEERTIELQQEIAERKQIEQQLERARIDAEAANRAKSEFLANMSHELRTPLNGILGYAQLLKEENHLTERSRSGLDTIERSGNHLLRLINEILDLAKIEAHKMELHETEFHLPGFLSGLSEMIRIRAQQKGIAFRYETTSELPKFIRTDERQLSQILLNLLSNAVKFTDKGGVSFKVGESQSLGQHSRIPSPPHPDDSDQEDAPSIRFQVSDSGIGIAASELQEIFSPFAQVGDYTRRQEGTGLGLTISRQIAQLLGSELHVRSAPNQGSVFWFDLPLAEIVQEPAVPVRQHRSIKGVIGEAPTILIADDKDENRMLLKDMLQPLGFRILEAKTGLDAIEQTQRHHPGLILMDLIMPKMDGFEATKHIRQEFGADAPVILAISASAFKQTRQKSLQSGCHDFLSKPISSQELFAQMKRYLNLEWRYDEPPPAVPGTGKE